MAGVLPFAPISETPASRPAEPRPDRVPLGKLLIDKGVVTEATVAAAIEDQAQQDQKLGRILVANHGMERRDLTAALSRQSGLGEVDFATSPPDPALALQFDPGDCLRLEAIPWRQVGGTRVIAIANPDDAAAAIETFGEDGARVALAIADPDAIRQAIARTFSARLRDAARDRCPSDFSCVGWQSARRGRMMGLALALAAVVTLLAPKLALLALLGWVLLVTLATTGLRVVALFAHFRPGQTRPTVAATQLSDFRRLPQISLLVPLLREEAVARQLMEALGAMDYPHALLDIKLVLEEDDEVTRAAIAQAQLPATVEVITVPLAALRTKPRAMNYALPFCRGEIIGVYDAEDRPDPAQLRAVARRFAEAPGDVACLQGFLDFYNSDRNWVARCFTLEYAIWFRVILKGVQRLGIPIPLGGTTVFFRRGALETVGAWDAFNVTEDADLGMRLARFGLRTEMLESTTEEEANFRLRPWIRQRSRWLKGYALTWASHMRDPAALYRDLGLRGFLGFQVLFLGAITSYLAMPLFWLAWLASFGFGLEIWGGFPGWLVTLFFATTAVGSAVTVSIALVAARASGRTRQLRWVPLLFVYWPLGAIAAWRAVGELFTRPFHWHKTEHGVGVERAEGATPKRRPIIWRMPSRKAPGARSLAVPRAKHA